LARAIPSQLRLTLERRIAREVPVQVRFAGPPPIGFRIASVGTFPDRVLIAGPESHAQRVQYVETDPIQLSGVSGVASFHVQVYVPDPQVSLDEPGPVSVRVEVEKIPPKLVPKK
jgi:YbbR domain-containing protein